MGQGESLRGWQVALMGHIDVHGTNISGWEINLLYTGATPLNHVLVPVISCNLTSTYIYIYICIIMYVYIIFNYANIGQDTADPCCDQEEMRMGACRSGEREVVVAEASG